MVEGGDDTPLTSRDDNGFQNDSTHRQQGFSPYQAFNPLIFPPKDASAYTPPAQHRRSSSWFVEATLNTLRSAVYDLPSHAGHALSLVGLTAEDDRRVSVQTRYFRMMYLLRSLRLIPGRVDYTPEHVLAAALAHASSASTPAVIPSEDTDAGSDINSEGPPRSAKMEESDEVFNGSAYRDVDHTHPHINEEAEAVDIVQHTAKQLHLPCSLALLATWALWKLRAQAVHATASSALLSDFPLHVVFISLCIHAAKLVVDEDHPACGHLTATSLWATHSGVPVSDIVRCHAALLTTALPSLPKPGELEHTAAILQQRVALLEVAAFTDFSDTNAALHQNRPSTSVPPSFGNVAALIGTVTRQPAAVWHPLLHWGVLAYLVAAAAALISALAVTYGQK